MMPDIASGFPDVEIDVIVDIEAALFFFSDLLLIRGRETERVCLSVICFSF